MPRPAWPDSGRGRAAASDLLARPRRARGVRADRRRADRVARQPRHRRGGGRRGRRGGAARVAGARRPAESRRRGSRRRRGTTPSTGCAASRGIATSSRCSPSPTRRADAAGEADADERLPLLFGCCHPALSPDAQLALTLRAVCGLTTAQIARATFSAGADGRRSGSCGPSARSARPGSRCGSPSRRSARSASTSC